MCEFEEKVRKNLIECGVGLRDAPGSPGDCPSSPGGPGAGAGDLRIGVAVSGGADSISLLLSLSSIFPSLFVITVNHNIRPAAESRGDVDFVLEVCEKLRCDGREIVCEVVELEPGLVERTAAERGGGIEEAARYLRYEAFEKFIDAHGLDSLCLAHNQNDQLETVLMRFLQGSVAEAAAGIRARRGQFVRPLLGIERHEIEEYVASRGFGWRTDKTNYETDYLRNKIRLKLVPFLNEEFPGWQKAVLSGAEKAGEDAAFIKSCVEAFPFSEADGKVVIPLEDFLKAQDSLKYRILLEACNRAGESSRIPHQFLKDVVQGLSRGGGGTSIKHFNSIDIICEKNHLFVKKHEECNTDLIFSAIIEKTGKYEFPFGPLDVFNYREQAGKKLVSVCAGEGEKAGIAEEVSIPFLVRNVAPGDTVLCADGSEKKVADIFSDWHVEASKRSLVPVIQLLDDKNQRIKAVLAGFLGYKDWIVKL